MMDDGLRGFVIRFTVLHVVTYWVVGMMFFQLQPGYEEALAVIETFEHWRDLEDITMVAAVFFGQFVRGALLAVFLYPFYTRFVHARSGWLLLFGLLYGLTFLGSPVFFPETVQVILDGSLRDLLRSLEIGVPEVTVQMLVFSWLLWRWERRVISNHCEMDS
ncbi:hypothetical protein [Natrarchaeobius oligotrophus]|nr:hypothetical protein [Natrarchaeobius chitinivorans]